ncbi:hypothetical protein LQW54_012082 [Pestalotiopsis sp. IQ-011]
MLSKSGTPSPTVKPKLETSSSRASPTTFWETPIRSTTTLKELIGDDENGKEDHGWILMDGEDHVGYLIIIDGREMCFVAQFWRLPSGPCTTQDSSEDVLQLHFPTFYPME